MMSRRIYLRGAANWVCRCKFISCPGIWIVRHDIKQWLVDEISQIKPRHLTISQADALVVYVYCDLRSSILSSSLEVIPFQLARLYLHHMGLVIVLSMTFYLVISYTAIQAN